MQKTIDDGSGRTVGQASHDDVHGEQLKVVALTPHRKGRPCASLQLEVTIFSTIPIHIFVDQEMFHIESGGTEIPLTMLGEYPERDYRWAEVIGSCATKDPSLPKLKIQFIRGAGAMGPAQSGVLIIFGDNRYEKIGELGFSVKEI